MYELFLIRNSKWPSEQTTKFFEEKKLEFEHRDLKAKQMVFIGDDTYKIALFKDDILKWLSSNMDDYHLQLYANNGDGFFDLSLILPTKELALQFKMMFM